MDAKQATTIVVTAAATAAVIFLLLAVSQCARDIETVSRSAYAPTPFVSGMVFRAPGRYAVKVPENQSFQIIPAYSTYGYGLDNVEGTIQVDVWSAKQVFNVMTFTPAHRNTNYCTPPNWQSIEVHARKGPALVHVQIVQPGEKLDISQPCVPYR